MYYQKSNYIILPGVGSFDNGMKELSNRGFSEKIKFIIQRKDFYLLGICLGMQILGNSSEEGSLPGLGLIDGYSKRFNFSNSEENFRIPHMGWNSINIVRKDRLTSGTQNENRYYFAHSFHFKSHDQANVLAKTFYGVEFNSVINKGNIYGTQFHPEKSHKYGMRFLKEFMSL